MTQKSIHAWWTIPAELAKNGLAYRVPLSRQAVAILERLRKRADGPWVFPSPTTDRPIEKRSKAAERLRDRSKVPDLRLHDLRRTAASLMTGMGISRLTVKKILDHAERDVTAVNDRHSHDPEKRTTLDAWGRRVEAMVIIFVVDEDGTALLAAGLWFNDWERGGTLLEEARHMAQWDQTMTLLWFESEEVPPLRRRASDDRAEPAGRELRDDEEECGLQELDGNLRWPSKRRR